MYFSKRSHEISSKKEWRWWKNSVGAHPPHSMFHQTLFDGYTKKNLPKKFGTLFGGQKKQFHRSLAWFTWKSAPLESRRFQSWKSSFSGSMLNFKGVNVFKVVRISCYLVVSRWFNDFISRNVHSLLIMWGIRFPVWFMFLFNIQKFCLAWKARIGRHEGTTSRGELQWCHMMSP